MIILFNYNSYVTIMEYWDKVQQAKKSVVTEKVAKVTVDIQDPKLGEPFKVVVNTSISHQDLNINGVYVKIRGIERVIITNVKIPAASDVGVNGDVEIVGVDLQRSAETNELEQSIYGPANLTANEDYVWEAEVQLPQGALPSYRGFNAAHEWEILAGLDARGFDPDSGWKKFIV
ncbi:hypothetical protein R9C00_17590 [Flammeovirgaceae bacterium SG7u.111]|nr:hypothetical protein [Flammeovirgaceae bacterium SG7u.132]WPO33517.1 hypothetical protein R9C00_17590 [Flammeovirgaceae bacterium SG7u.111]